MRQADWTTLPGVYLIYCHANKKAYVGSSNRIRSRLATHRHQLRRGTHGNPYLQNAWNAYGEDAFSMGPLQTCPVEDKLVVEQWWIDIWMSDGMAFNRNPKAESSVGVKLTEEQKEAMSVWFTKHPPFGGRKHTDEAKAMIAASACLRLADPKNNPFYGKTHTEEVKKRIAQVHMGNKSCVGRQMSEKTREAIGRGNTGKVRTSEKFKAAASHTARTILASPEIRKKAADSIRGRKRSPDTVARMSNSAFVRAHAKANGIIGPIQTSYISPATGETVAYTLK